MDKFRFSPWDITNNIFDNFSRNKIAKIKKFNENYELDWTNYENTINNVYNEIINSSDPKNILLFGYIQSGKTDFIIGLILKLFSEKKVNLIFSINQNNNSLLKQTVDRMEENYNQNVYTYKKTNSDIKNIITKLENNECVTIFLLKNVKHLEQAIKLIIELNNLRIKYNALIIDDEGDAASFDNVKKEEHTEIFSKIKKIKELSYSNYLSITATPFAHFLLDKKNNLKPDYAFVLKPSTGYTGIDYFVNSSISRPLANFIEIKPIEKDSIDELFINDDFIKAIKVYLVQCFWWTYIKKFSGKPRMLINIHKNKITHNEIYNQINKIVKDLINDEDFFENFKCLGIDYDRYKEEFMIAKNYILKEINSKILNGDTEQKESLDKQDEYSYTIVIGHTKLDRGLTIIDLINTFISSRSKNHPNADVILQQARFLGYRDKYKEMIRIFLTNDLINDYEDISNNSIFFKEIIEKNKNFNEIENYVPIKSEKLYPTRQTVANYERINTNQRNDIINNIFKEQEQDLDIKNKLFFNKFNELFIFSNKLDDNQQKIIEFENIKDFAEKFEITKKDSLINFFIELSCKNDDLFEKKCIKKIVEEWDKKIILRLIKENTRKISNRNVMGYFTIGKGNYSSNEYKFWLDDKYLSIDIIPINVYSDDNKIKRIVYRTRIFIPRIYIKNKSGYIS